MKPNKPRILFWDIETSLMKVLTFQLKTKYINPEFILEDWHIISAAYKWSDNPTIYKLKNKHGDNDSALVAKLADVVYHADVLVHHNGDKFDLKKLNTRMLKHGILPTSHKPLTVDTLKEARKHFSLSSNSLDYIAQYLKLGQKAPHSRAMWIEEAKGSKKAVNDIAAYNVPDVELLEKVYFKMRPYISHPNLTGFTQTEGCTHCASTKVQKRGFTVTRGGLQKQRCHCQSCGAWFQLKVV